METLQQNQYLDKTRDSATIAGDAPRPFAMTELPGLTDEDLPAVRSLADKIDPANPLSISEFGRDVAEHTAGYTDSLLEQVNSRDLDKAGTLLTNVMLAAKRLNLEGLSDRRSRIPVIGRYIDRFKLTKDKVVSHFQTAKGQIDDLMVEINTTSGNLSERILTMESMFGSVSEEYRLLALHIAGAKMRLDELKVRAEELRRAPQNDLGAQQLADLERAVSNLDYRIGNLQVLQHSALQGLPEIRVVQANNQMLVDKFHTIRELTIPAWKRQFALALSLNEQKNAVELTQAIDGATNELLTRNAQLLHQNAVSTAKSNQRLVIDVETLEKVQDTLISTVQDVIKIQRDGAAQRRSLETKLVAMRNNLQRRLTAPTTQTVAGEARAA